jgi:hypothetical protein
MNRTKETHERIRAEIAREKAAALGGRAARGEAPGEPRHDRARLLGEYDDARARALHARLALVIQRESVGLRQHRAVDQQFPEPPRRPPA